MKKIPLQFFLAMFFMHHVMNGMQQCIYKVINKLFSSCHWAILAGPFLTKAVLRGCALYDDIHSRKKLTEELEECSFRETCKQVSYSFGLDPQKIAFLRMKSNDSEELQSVYGFYRSVYFSPKYVSDYNFYEHIIMRFLFPGYADELHESVRFLVGRELHHIKNNDEILALCFTSAIPFITHISMNNANNLLKKTMGYGRNNISMPHNFIHARRIPVAFGKLLFALIAERYFRAYLEYRADRETVKRLGSKTCRVAARIFEKKATLTRITYASLYFDLAQKVGKHVNVYPVLKECAFDGQCRRITQLLVEKTYFLWEQWSPIYALRTCYPSNAQRALYLNKLADRIDKVAT